MSLACRVIVDTHVKATYLLARERSVSSRLNARIHIPVIVGGRATRTRRQGGQVRDNSAVRSSSSRWIFIRAADLPGRPAVLEEAAAPSLLDTSPDSMTRTRPRERERE